MFIRNWKKEICTIPNLLSLIRLALIPVYVSLYRAAQSTMDYYAAGAVLAVSCITDMIDGKVARKYQMVSTVGKLLDPLADKLTQLSLLLCLSLRHRDLVPVLWLLVIKESIQLIACILAYRNGHILNGALFIGKLCTAVLFIGFILLVLFPNLPSRAVQAIACLDSCFLAASFAGYSLTFCDVNRHAENFHRK